MGNIIDSIRDQDGTVYDIHSTDAKSITLKLLAKIQNNSGYGAGGYSYGPLRLYLNGFTNRDIGTYIWLFRRSNNNHTYIHKCKSFTHPANYDSERKDIAKIGYGTIAGRYGSHGMCIYTEDIPSWMPHNGYLQTEWEITSEHIEQGYMDIDIGTEFLSLIIPFLDEGQSTYGETLGFADDKPVHIIGRRAHFITYAQVKEDKPICFSRNTLYIGTPSRNNRVFPNLSYCADKFNQLGSVRRLYTGITVRLM